MYSTSDVEIVNVETDMKPQPDSKTESEVQFTTTVCDLKSLENCVPDETPMVKDGAVKPFVLQASISSPRTNRIVTNLLKCPHIELDQNESTAASKVSMDTLMTSDSVPNPSEVNLHSTRNDLRENPPMVVQSLDNKADEVAVQSTIMDKKSDQTNCPTNSSVNSIVTDASIASMAECPHLQTQPKSERVERQENISSNECREFDVLDEIGQHSEDGYMSDSNNSDGSSYDSSDLPIDEIDAMLEEGVPKRRKRNDGSVEEINCDRKIKTVLEDIKINPNHFEVFPEGWIQVSHNCGIPIFLQKELRVCTLSRPYFLGKGSVRKHQIPLSSIPCLQYKRNLQKREELLLSKRAEEEESLRNGILDNHLQIGNETTMPNVHVETVQESNEAHLLQDTDVREYCEKLFRFKTIEVTRFKSWTDRRRFNKTKKLYKHFQRPTLPEGTKLITLPVPVDDSERRSTGRTTKQWTMNPNGKSHVCVLHEYVQHALKKQPRYIFKELENAATPYSATVMLGDMPHGVGYGSSKRLAKLAAAKTALITLIPEIKDKITEEEMINGRVKIDQVDLSFFDDISIEDQRVNDLCIRTSEPSPHSILMTCIHRNFGLGDSQVKYEVKSLRHQKNECIMTVGKHTATVVCKSKRDGKQRASQALLQALHPHITNWGSLLRLYGSRSMKSVREKKREEQDITMLQGKAADNSPNFAILDKLKLEIQKQKEAKAQIQPIGKFIPPEDINLPSSSGHLKNVDL